MTVQTFTTAAWALVGFRVTYSAATYTSIAVDSTGVSYVALGDGTYQGKASVLKNTGTNMWM